MHFKHHSIYGVHQHPHVEKKSFKEYYTHFDLPQMPSEATQFPIICRDYSMMIASGIKIGTSNYGISIVPHLKNIMIKPFLFAAVVLAGLATYHIINKGYSNPDKYLKID